MAVEQQASRQVHLEWCKQRAREYLDRGDYRMPVTGKGWYWVANSPKWHYFKDAKTSLCGRWWVLALDPANLQDSDHDSPDNCKSCNKKREAMEKKEAAA